MTQAKLAVVVLSVLALNAQNQLPPGVLFSTSVTADSSTYPDALATDSSGNVFVAGYTTSSTLPTTTGVIQPALKAGLCEEGVSNPVPLPCPDAFIAKLSPSGAVLFLTYFGGTGGDQVLAIAVDAPGNIWIAGGTGSSDLPLTSNAAQKIPGDGFVAELDSSGTRLLYSSYVAVAVSSMAFGKASPAGTVIYVAGYGYDFPVTSGSLNIQNGTCYLAALAPDGSLAAQAQFGGSCSSIAASVDGSVYVAGEAGSGIGSDLPSTPGVWQPAPRSDINAYAAKLDGSLSRVIWATYAGGSGQALGGSIQEDPSGDVWLTGGTSSLDFPVIPGGAWSTPSVPAGTFVGFLVRLSPDGARALTSEYVPGDPQGLVFDSAGNVVLSTSLDEAAGAFAATPGAEWPCQVPNSSSPAGAFAKLDATGTHVLWATFAGPFLPDPWAGIALEPDGTLVTAGPPALRGEYGVAAARMVTSPGPPRLEEACVKQSGAPYASQSIAPGELISIYAAGFGPQQGVTATVGPEGTIPNALGGVQVLIEGVPAPLLYVSSSQINLVAPFLLDGQNAAHIRIVAGDQSSNEVIFGVAEAAPEIFQITYQGTPYAAALNQNMTVNTPSNPAHPGDIVSIFVSGAGQMSPAGEDGQIAQGSSQHVVQPVHVHLSWNGVPGNADAEIHYAGDAPGLVSGVVQINFRIPANATLYDPDMYLSVMVGAQTSAQSLIAVTQSY